MTVESATRAGRRVLIAVLWLGAAPAAAQVDMGAGVGPEAVLHSERSRPESTPVLPLALAASLAFDATTWAQVSLSTVPALELTSLLKRGYYKLELLQVVLLARAASVPLKEIVASRDKGKSLREIAQSKSLDFDALYEESLAVDRRVVEELLPSVMTVRAGPAEGAVEHPAAPRRPRRRRKGDSP